MKPIETERLILREWKPEDLAPFAAINQDPKVLECLPGPLTESETAAMIEKIQRHFKQYGFGLYACVLKATSICILRSACNLDLGPRESSRGSTIANGSILPIWTRLRSSNPGALAQSKFQVSGRPQYIGYVGLYVPDFEAHFTPCVEIGWRLSSAAWGKGYAAEAARAVIKAAFEQFALHEVVSFTVPSNYRSIRVMEKIGMTRDSKGDFDHPKLPVGHPLRRHVLYRITKEQYAANK